MYLPAMWVLTTFGSPIAWYMNKLDLLPGSGRLPDLYAVSKSPSQQDFEMLSGELTEGLKDTESVGRQKVRIQAQTVLAETRPIKINLPPNLPSPENPTNDNHGLSG